MSNYTAISNFNLVSSVCASFGEAPHRYDADSLITDCQFNEKKAVITLSNGYWVSLSHTMVDGGKWQCMIEKGGVRIGYGTGEAPDYACHNAVSDMVSRKSD